MGRDRGGVQRTLGRIFRERQIYHRSEGVVRFIKLSARSQLAMASIMGAALLWVAYASVNVVFKEQIIVSKEQQRRDQEAAYRSRLDVAESAVDRSNERNYLYAREFDATISGLKNQHDALKDIVEHKSAIDRRLEGLSEALSAAGAPGGKQLKGSNRLMIDPIGREPTPRQSRTSALRQRVLDSIMAERPFNGIEDEVLDNMRVETAQLSARQVVLMARLEEDMRRSIDEMEEVLNHTGINLAPLIERHRLAVTPLTQVAEKDGAEFSAQGGPFIPVTDATGSDTYFKSAARVEGILKEMTALDSAIENVPLGSPVIARHRMSSRFGRRWDPLLRNRRAFHKGLDFAGPRNTPIVATAAGRVSFAGVRGGFGRTVEIDHGNGLKTRFGHMTRLNVRAGQHVDVNDVIGFMGSTGRSTGTHLHYEVHYRGKQVDPLKFIEAGRYVFES